METFANLATGFGVVITPINLLFCFVGCFIGTAIGVLPGIGPLATIAMLTPITYGMGVETTLIMIAGIYYGALYGSSTTAILLNLPGEPSSAITSLDGHQMARQGRAGAALMVAALGSFFAGSVVTLLIALVSKPLAVVALEFGPHEYTAVLFVGLALTIALASGSLLKGTGAILVGMLLATTGTDLYTGTLRFTWGFVELSDGIGLVPMTIGIFGIAEIFRNLEVEESEGLPTFPVGRMRMSKEDIERSVAPVLRGTALGAVLGMFPGGGALISSLASYAIEKRISKHPEQFGRGAIEGVAGPESANNAGAQSAFIPMLSLGVPGNAVLALMMGVLMLQGIAPGPTFIRDHPNLFWGLIVSMWVGNAMLVVLNLPLIRMWILMIATPYRFIVPVIVTFSCVGVFGTDGDAFGVYLIPIFGIAGYILFRLGAEPGPFILGYVLSSMTEEYFRRAMIQSDGRVISFLERPISASILIGVVILFGVASLRSIRKRREDVFRE